MKKRILLVVLLAVCVGASTVAFAAERVVNYAYQAIPVTFAHGKVLGAAESMGLSQVYDTLLLKDFQGNFLPNLAERWEISDDSMVYTFHLRKDVKWTDGVGFTAKDVEFSYARLAKAPAFSWVFDVNIDHMEVPDDYTFKIFMKKPNALFISMLASPSESAIMAKHALEKYGDDYGTSVDKIVGTGAYIVTEWKPEVSISYKANENYFKGVPDIKNIVYNRVTDTNAAIVAIQTGELDLLLTPITGAAYKTLAGNPNIVLGDFMSARNEAIHMYVKDGVFSDVRMRRAVAHAIDKEDILTVAVDGLGQVIRYPGDVGSAITANPDYEPAITYEQSIEKARALVKEAGKEGASVVIKSYNTDPYATVGTYLQGVLSEIGLNATVAPMERATFLSELDKEMCDVFPLGWVSSSYDIEETLGSLLHSANLGTAGNYSFYKRQAELKRRQAWEDYEQYTGERDRLNASLNDMRSRSKAMLKTPKRMGNSEARLHKREGTERQEKVHNSQKALETRIEKLEVKEKPREAENVRIDFSLTDPPRNKIVIEANELDFSYGERAIFKDASFFVPGGSKTALIGPNGSGKTTLLNLIAGRQEGIRLAPKARIGYFYQGFENIDDDKTVLENTIYGSVQKELVVRLTLARLLIKRDDVLKPARVLSGGERIKLSFAMLFCSDCNVLLLDEPTNYLDMPSLEVLQTLLSEYEGTVLFVSHDRAFVETVATRLLIIENGPITAFEGTLSEYEEHQSRKNHSNY